MFSFPIISAQSKVPEWFFMREANIDNFMSEGQQLKDANNAGY